MVEDQTPSDASAPDQLGHYKVQGQIGQGGMAVVYRGVQPSLNREVAIKVLPPRFARSPELVARFDREANIAAQLNHPNIVQIIDRGKQGDTLFLVMEYVEGESLDKLIQRRELTPAKVADYAIQICDALEYAHSRGVVHRDLKPSNILIDAQTGRAKIADFGIAQIGTSVPGLSTLTTEHAALGTMNYMSPEQRTDSHTVTLHTDIFSFGIMLYEMLTGKLPIGHFKLPSHVNRDIPIGFDTIVKTCLQELPEDRYQSAGEIKDALGSITGWQTRYKEVAGRVGESVRHLADRTPPCLVGKRRYVAAGAGVALALVLALVFIPKGGDKSTTGGPPTAGAVSTASVAPTVSVPTPVPAAGSTPVVLPVRSPAVAVSSDAKVLGNIADAVLVASAGAADQGARKLKALVEIYDTDVASVEARFQLARLLESRGDFDSALEEYAQVVVKVEQFTMLDPNLPAALRRRAPEALLTMAGIHQKKAKRYDKKNKDAAALYERLVKDYPGSAQARLAQVAIDWKNTNAKMHWSVTVVGSKTKYDLATQRALCNRVQSEIDADAGGPLAPVALRLLADICDKPELKEKDKDAAQQARAQLDEYDKTPQASHLLAAAALYRRAGDARAEKKVYQQFLDHFPHGPRAALATARLKELRKRGP